MDGSHSVLSVFVDFRSQEEVNCATASAVMFDGAQYRAFDLFSEISKSELERSAKE